MADSTPTPAPVPTEEQKKQQELIKREELRKKSLVALCNTLRDIYNATIREIKDAKPPRQLTYIASYKNTVDAAQFKYPYHQKLFRELFKKHLHLILESYKNEDWLSAHMIKVQFGAEVPALQKKNMILPISQAYSEAVKLRSDLETKAKSIEDADPNGAATLRERFEYFLADELLANLFTVFKYAIEEDDEFERHIPAVKLNLAHYRQSAGLETTSKSGPDLNKKAGTSIHNMTGGKMGGIGGITSILGDITSIFGNEGFLEIAEKKIEEIENLDKDGNASVSDVLQLIAGGAKDFEPVVNEAMEAFK